MKAAPHPRTGVKVKGAKREYAGFPNEATAKSINRCTQKNYGK